MAPVKFDDLAKTANDIINEDYKLTGYEFKAKQKTNWDGTVLTTTVDVVDEKTNCTAPASKLSWKFPAPFGISIASIDKLEIDKKGKFKFEASSAKLAENLKMELKSDLAQSISGGMTYTGLKDTQMKFEASFDKPDAFTAELTHAQGPVTFGVKMKGDSLEKPDLGMRVAQGPFFGAFFFKDQYQAYSAHAHWNAAENLKLAGVYDCKKAVGTFSIGFLFELSKQTKIKAKVQRDKTLSFSVKHDLAKGFSLLGGVKYDTAKGNTYGVSVSIE